MEQGRKARKKSTIGKFFLELLTLIPLMLSLGSNLSSLIKYEFYMTRRNLFAAFIFAIFIFTFILTFWAILMVVLFLVLSANLNLMWSLTLMILLNILLILTTSFFMIRLKSGLFFPQTAKILQQMGKIKSSD